MAGCGFSIPSRRQSQDLIPPLNFHGVLADSSQAQKHVLKVRFGGADITDFKASGADLPNQADGVGDAGVKANRQ